MEPITKRLLKGLTVHELADIRAIIDELLTNHSVKVEDLKGAISVRLEHALINAEITDLVQITKMHKFQFEKLRGVGVLTLKEMEEILNYYDLCFKPDQYSLSFS